MIDVTKSIWTNKVGGIELKFEDISTSNTVPYVFGELKHDYYGLEQIKLSKDDVIIDEPNNASPNSSKANNSSKNVQKSSKFNSKVLENDDNEEELDLHSEVDEPDSNDDSDEEVVSKVVEPNSDDSDEEGTPVTPPVKSKPKSKSSKSKK
jgi:hypothetical protein